MSVYVDPLFNYGFKLGPSCHLTADTLEELHAAAKSVGMKMAWFQNDGRQIPHYDLVSKRRILAVKNGAIEISRREMGEMVLKFKKQTATAMIDLLEKRFMCLTPFPGGDVKEGDIIGAATETIAEYFERYPKIFRPMPWWEKRTAHDLPLFIYWPDSYHKEITKVTWSGDGKYFFAANNEYETEDQNILPATLEEYNSYITRQVNK